jgi:tRNA A-37 threonylcarbamoyl transferase component Bud32
MTLSQCPECGINLPADAPEGLCPQCLLKGVISSARDAAQSAPAERTTPYGGPAAPAVEELAPLFPQLEILALIGQGGMGAVYQARQPSLDRLVAVKVLPREAGRDPAFAERFNREARALARLSHSNIVAVHDVGKAGEFYFFVMEYVNGANLRQVLRDGRLTPEQALRIVPQICDALQYAHEEGIVHRDIKPENILLDRKGRVKIADFGLAKLLGRDTGNFTLTGSRQVMGTLYYMAPEQVERPLEVDHRADIYSLGVVFYEMLTGQLPVGRFPMPSEKAGTDAFLDGVVLRALEREPERRYQHASDVKTDVEAPAHRATLLARGTGAVDVEVARHQLRGPAISLMVMGWLGPLGWLVAFLIYTLFLYLDSRDRMGGNSWFWTMLNRGYDPFLILFGANAVVGGFLIAGARKMRRLEAYEFSVITSLMAGFQIATPTFPVSFIIGGWAFWVLRKPEVKAAFAEELRRRARAPAAGEPPRTDRVEADIRTAGLIGLIVPVIVVALAVAGTIVAVLYHRTGEDITTPLVVAWSIAAVIAVVVTVRSLGVIRHSPLPAEDVPARARAGRAAGLIGLVVPVVVVSLAVVATVVAVLNQRPGEDPTIPLIVAWSIAAAVVLVVIVASLNAVGQVRQAPAEPEKPLPHAARVRWPALGLLLVGVLHTALLPVAAGMGWFPLMGSGTQQLPARGALPGPLASVGLSDVATPLFADLAAEPPVWYRLAVVLLLLLSGSLAALIICGAVQMLRLRNHGLAMAAAILALLPCGPAWPIGLPVGIWALAVLTAPEVKAAFGRRQGET